VTETILEPRGCARNSDSVEKSDIVEERLFGERVY
jgi:hypothetical protein